MMMKVHRLLIRWNHYEIGVCFILGFAKSDVNTWFFKDLFNLQVTVIVYYTESAYVTRSDKKGLIARQILTIILKFNA